MSFPPYNRAADFGTDTWTNFLAEKRNEVKHSGETQSSGSKNTTIRSGDGALPSLSVPEMMEYLSLVVSNQNAACLKDTEELKARRLTEERQRTADAACNTSTELDHRPCMKVFQNLLAVSRDLWKAVLTERVNRISPPKPSGSSRLGDASLPTFKELFQVIVEGLNSPDTLKYAEKEVLLDGVPSTGIDAFGVYSVFKIQIRALAQWESLCPSFENLRRYFSDLSPERLRKAPSGSPMDSTIAVYEAQLDTFLRFGDQPKVLEKVLREGVHASVRRLYYARTLQLPLTVTDGRPTVEHADFQCNHFPAGFLPGYLTFATQKTRDRIKRRLSHSSASNSHSAHALQPLILQDATAFVGDSEKYFVYLDDVEVLSATLVVEQGVSEGKLKETLDILGRPEFSIHAYRASKKELPPDERTSPRKQKNILQAVLPASSTLLIAPICNVTGDTVEQYEIVSRMFSQLWKRITGPTPELVQCCWIFERLTEEFALPAVTKAVRVLQHPPLLLAIQWMITGFSEIFTPSEVLNFWDLILAYHVRERSHRSILSCAVGTVLPVTEEADETPNALVPCSLWLLPIMAAALFIYRAPLVERVETREELLQIFSVTHQLRALPLIQLLLFSNVPS